MPTSTASVSISPGGHPGRGRARLPERDGHHRGRIHVDRGRVPAEQLTAYDIAGNGTLSAPRVWATTPGEHPDGICLDATGAIWYADVGNQHCVRVRRGGEVLATVDLDRGAFACALSRGADPKLFVVGQNWGGPDAVGGATGQVVTFPAPAPGDGHP